MEIGLPALPFAATSLRDTAGRASRAMTSIVSATMPECTVGTLSSGSEAVGLRRKSSFPQKDFVENHGNTSTLSSTIASSVANVLHEVKKREALSDSSSLHLQKDQIAFSQNYLGQVPTNASLSSFSSIPTLSSAQSSFFPAKQDTTKSQQRTLHLFSSQLSKGKDDANNMTLPMTSVGQRTKSLRDSRSQSIASAFEVGLSTFLSDSESILQMSEYFNNVIGPNDRRLPGSGYDIPINMSEYLTEGGTCPIFAGRKRSSSSSSNSSGSVSDQSNDNHGEQNLSYTSYLLSHPSTSAPCSVAGMPARPPPINTAPIPPPLLSSFLTISPDVASGIAAAQQEQIHFSSNKPKFPLLQISFSQLSMPSSGSMVLSNGKDSIADPERKALLHSHGVDSLPLGRRAVETWEVPESPLISLALERVGQSFSSMASGEKSPYAQLSQRYSTQQDAASNSLLSSLGPHSSFGKHSETNVDAQRSPSPSATSPDEMDRSEKLFRSSQDVSNSLVHTTMARTPSFSATSATALEAPPPLGTSISIFGSSPDAISGPSLSDNAVRVSLQSYADTKPNSPRFAALAHPLDTSKLMIFVAELNESPPSTSSISSPTNPLMNTPTFGASVASNSTSTPLPALPSEGTDKNDDFTTCASEAICKQKRMLCENVEYKEVGLPLPEFHNHEDPHPIEYTPSLSQSPISFHNPSELLAPSYSASNVRFQSVLPSSHSAEVHVDAAAKQLAPASFLHSTSSMTPSITPSWHFPSASEALLSRFMTSPPVSGKGSVTKDSSMDPRSTMQTVSAPYPLPWPHISNSATVSTCTPSSAEYSFQDALHITISAATMNSALNTVDNNAMSSGSGSVPQHPVAPICAQSLLQIRAQSPPGGSDSFRGEIPVESINASTKLLLESLSQRP